MRSAVKFYSSTKSWGRQKKNNHRKQKKKKVDECKSHCLLQCASWKKIMSQNLQLINSSTSGPSVMPATNSAANTQMHQNFTNMPNMNQQARMLGQDHQALR